MTPLVSIVVLNYNHPEVIGRLLPSLATTACVPYEVVVVDNGSEPAVVELLRGFQARGWITTLVAEPANRYFSEGNNIGVRNSNPASAYILLLNSDTEIVRPDWLAKMVQWMEGVPEILPYTWSDHPTVPSPGPRDIVSIGWSWDEAVPGRARPEGWCCMIRRSMWREISPDFPFHSGIEEMLAGIVRDGGRCGVLSQYSKYVAHYECGSEAHLIKAQLQPKRRPDMAGWWRGLTPPESLDFTLGPHEHQSYMEW